MRHVAMTLCILAALAAGAGPAVADVRPAYIVVDADTGAVLSHRSADTPWYPASITKVMTAYVVFRAMAAGEVAPKSAVKVSQNALNEPPSKMGFAVGTVLTVDNALKMMIVKSANDIAVALAEAVAGSEKAFIDRMNAEARRLGMNATHFNNPNGLPDDLQRSTARDLAVLSRAVWQEFPQYRTYFEIPAIRVGEKLIRSYNTLLDRYHGANGMKTGFICDSGYNMVASASRDGRTLMAVVLGSDSAPERAELAASLLDRGFRRWISIAGRPKLESFRARGSTAQPASLREEICSAEARAARAEAARKPRTDSALQPRFAVMDPVRVYTGGAAIPARNVPIPRRRPERAEQTALGDGDATTVQ